MCVCVCVCMCVDGHRYASDYLLLPSPCGITKPLNAEGIQIHRKNAWHVHVVPSCVQPFVMWSKSCTLFSTGSKTLVKEECGWLWLWPWNGIPPNQEKGVTQCHSSSLTGPLKDYLSITLHLLDVSDNQWKLMHQNSLTNEPIADQRCGGSFQIIFWRNKKSGSCVLQIVSLHDHLACSPMSAS